MKNNAKKVAVGVSLGVVVVIIAVLVIVFALLDKNKEKEIKVFNGFFCAQLDEIGPENTMQQKIAEKTGAKCIEKWLTEKDDATNIISDMIISNEYPDYIYATNDGHQKLLEANAYIPIDEYWDDYPNLKNYLTEEEWDRVREDDGHVYIVPVFSKYYMRDTTTRYNDEAFWIQIKVLQWAGYPEINTLDEYFDLIERYLEANPIGENGQPNIGYEILADPSIFFCLENPPQFLAGYPNDGACIVDEETLTAIDYNTTDTAKKWFKKLNEEYHKGIIDSGCFVLTPEQYFEKLATGNVLGMVDQYWNFCNSVNKLPSECTYVPLGVVIEEGIEEHYHSLPAFNYSQGIGISVSCDDVEGAVKFMNDLLDPEIHTLRFWGEEGIDYMVDENGIFYRTDEQTELRKNDEYNYNHRCLYNYFPYYSGMNRDGINAYNPGNQPTEFFKKLSSIEQECLTAYGAETYVELLNPATENKPWYPMWSFANSVTEDTDYGKVKANIEKVKLEYLPKIVMSNDFETAWAEYLEEYNKNDVQLYMDALTEEVRKRAKK